MTTRATLDMLGALAPSGGDDTAAINAALATGRDVLLAPGTYLANNLTMSTASQRLVALGNARITKNASGPIITVSGADCVLEGVGFRGESATPAYTGDNISITADNVRLINCGSRWAYGYAVRCTGSQLLIQGSCDVYQTANGAGYDIGVGQSGVLTLYHQITDIRSTQSTGGIVFVDCGSTMVKGCQFGKLYVQAGTQPGGVNGGMFHGNRITGNVNIEQANAVFVGNQFGLITVNLAAGTSGHVVDATNTIINGGTITDASNNSNVALLTDIAFQAYTPAWTAASVNPALGNGALVGYYSKRGKLVTASFRLTIGSTTTQGTGAWYVTLPVAPSGSIQQAGQAVIAIAGGNTYAATIQTLGDGTARCVIAAGPGASTTVGAGVPVAWTASSELRASITYLAA